MLKPKIAIILAVSTLALSLLAPVGGASSQQGDAVVTKSYIDKVFIPALTDYAMAEYREGFKLSPTAIEQAISKARQVKSPSSVDELTLVVLDEVRGRQIRYAQSGTVISLSAGETLVGGQGCMVSVVSGTAFASGQIIDFTTGADITSGTSPAANHKLCLMRDSGLNIITASKIEIFGYYRVIPSPRPKYEDIADALYKMGLFAGTNTGYELERPATRIEILVMLIKLLGENDAATAYKGTHPFKDVPAWANSYVAYAYSKGYTAGTSATAFSPGSLATGDQYATFVLKALGYDSNRDFNWSQALSYAQQIGLISPGEAPLLGQPFLRDKMVYLSYYSLYANYKGKDSTLLQRLVSNGKIEQVTADAAAGGVTRTRP